MVALQINLWRIALKTIDYDSEYRTRNVTQALQVIFSTLLSFRPHRLTGCVKAISESMFSMFKNINLFTFEILIRRNYHYIQEVTAVGILSLKVALIPNRDASFGGRVSSRAAPSRVPHRLRASARRQPFISRLHRPSSAAQCSCVASRALVSERTSVRCAPKI